MPFNVVKFFQKLNLLGKGGVFNLTKCVHCNVIVVTMRHYNSGTLGHWSGLVWSGLVCLGLVWSYLISLNSLVFKNIAYVGSSLHFVFVFVFVSVFVFVFVSVFVSAV